MGVEAPSVSIGPAVAAARVGVEGAASVSGMEAAPLGIKFDLSWPRSDVATAGENMINKTIINPQPLHIRQVEEIASSAWRAPLEPEQVIKPPITAVIEHPLNRVREIWDELTKQPSLTESMLFEALLAKEAVSKAKAEPKVTPSARPYIWEQAVPSPKSKPESKSGLASTYPVAQPVFADQIVEEQEVIVEDKNQEASEILEEEEVEVEKRIYVLDEKALGKRKNVVIEAVRKAKEAASKVKQKISGPLIGKYLVELFSKRKSEVESEATRGKGPDGSIPELEQTISSYGEFESDQKAEKISLKETYGKPPIKIRQDGEKVTAQDVERVYKEHQVKPNVLNIFKKRQIKKGPGPAGEVVGLEVERRIEDDPNLAEVFDLAA